MYGAGSGAEAAAATNANSAECRSSRAEQTASPHPTLAIGGRARRAAADLLHAVLTERWERGDDSASNRVLADRYLEIDEKQVRQYRDGRKHVPLAALVVLPMPIVRDIVDRLLAMRGATEREGAVLIRRGVEALKTSTRDRAEALRVVHDAQRQLLELAAHLTENK